MAVASGRAPHPVLRLLIDMCGSRPELAGAKRELERARQRPGLGFQLKGEEVRELADLRVLFVGGRLSMTRTKANELIAELLERVNAAELAEAEKSALARLAGDRARSRLSSI